MPPISDQDRFSHDLIALAGQPPSSARRLGLAVSGGPDSLAMLLLARSAFPGRIVAATVDHGLRPEAAEEARFVGRICDALGVPHAILTGDGGMVDDADGPHDRARRLRYDLLAGWSASNALGWIATAHHADDQAETLLMRLARGSGLQGLTGIGATAAWPGCAPILRPLLGWRRTDLSQIVARAGISPIDDPSNRDPRYDRTHMRDLMRANPLLDPARLALSAAHLEEAEQAILWAVDDAWRNRASVDPDHVTVDARDLPRTLRFRLLQRAIAALAIETRAHRRLRGSAVDGLLRRLDAGESGMILDFIVQPGPPWTISPAPPRRKR